MCKKTVFYNTYSDGTTDISERVHSCFPGYICPDPRVVEYDRSYNCPRSQAKLTQARDDRLKDSSSPSSSRSVSPASSATSIEITNERSRRHRRSEVYVNGHKVSSTSSTNTMSQPIPIRRSATMPYGDREPMPERGRRPIIVEPMAPLPPQVMHTPRPSPGSSHYPLGPSPIPRTATSRPVDVFHHTTAPSSSPRRRTPTRDFHDFRDARDARDLRTDYRTDYREYRSPTRAERPFSLRRRTSEREPPVATTTTAIPASSINRRNSVSTSGTRDFLTPHYRSATAAGRPRADSSPMGYASAEDAAERAERRRRRRHNLERATVTPSSVPTYGNANIYPPHSHSRTGSGLDSGFSSSYESSGYTTASHSGSSFTSPTPSSTSASAGAAASEVRTSPATAAVKKNLRWQDDERRRQNEKIDKRPKLSRDETITPANAHAHAKMQGEVKSILKNTTPGASPRERSQSRRRETYNDDAQSTTNATIGSSSHIGRRGSFLGDADKLAGGVSGLNIHGNTPPASPRAPRSPRSPHHDESEAERARLRDRFDQKPVPPPFSMPPRSYAIGSSHRRRTDIWPPRDERF